MMGELLAQVRGLGKFGVSSAYTLAKGSKCLKEHCLCQAAAIAVTVEATSLIISALGPTKPNLHGLTREVAQRDHACIARATQSWEKLAGHMEFGLNYCCQNGRHLMTDLCYSMCKEDPPGVHVGHRERTWRRPPPNKACFNYP